MLVMKDPYSPCIMKEQSLELHLKNNNTISSRVHVMSSTMPQYKKAECMCGHK